MKARQARKVLSVCTNEVKRFSAPIIVGLFIVGASILLTPLIFDSLRRPSFNKEQLNKSLAAQLPVSQNNDFFIPSRHFVEKGPLRDWSIAEPELAVRSAIAFDIDNEQALYAYQPFLQLPIASIAKLFTGYLAVDRLGLDKEITLSEEAVANYGRAGDFSVGEIFTVRDLLTAALIASSNDAAYALAENIGRNHPAQEEEDFIADFLEMVNRFILKQNFSRTFMADATGLSPDTTSTAIDLVSLTKFILKRQPVIFQLSRSPRAVITDLVTRRPHSLVNTNTLLASLTAEIIGSKTGFTSEAGENMLLIEKYKGTRIVYVVLGAENRNSAVQRLVDWIHAAYDW